MNIDTTQNNTQYTLKLTGRLDTTTAGQLEAALEPCYSNATGIELDFKDVEYISSAGLRVLLSAQKTMNKKGKLIIRHINETVREVFEVTGFCDILTIE